MDTEDCSLNQSNSNLNVKLKCCNASICLAYIMSLLASGVIVHGFYLAFITRNKVWFILPGLGLCLILIGSCFYRAGSLTLYRENYGPMSRTKRKSKRAPTENALFESQLSLNMLPQCFSNFENYGSPSRILNSNGHRYLILPIDSVSPNVSNGIQIQNMISNAISHDDQQSNSLANKSDQNANSQSNTDNNTSNNLNNINNNNNNKLPQTTTTNNPVESTQQTCTYRHRANSNEITETTNSFIEDNSILIDLHQTSSQESSSNRLCLSQVSEDGLEEESVQSARPNSAIQQVIMTSELVVGQSRDIDRTSANLAESIESITGLVQPPIATIDEISTADTSSQCNEEPPSYNEVFEDTTPALQTVPNWAIYKTL